LRSLYNNGINVYVESTCVACMMSNYYLCAVDVVLLYVCILLRHYWAAICLYCAMRCTFSFVLCSLSIIIIIIILYYLYWLVSVARLGLDTVFILRVAIAIAKVLAVDLSSDSAKHELKD
jgi:hypothetical protein